MQYYTNLAAANSFRGYQRVNNNKMTITSDGQSDETNGKQTSDNHKSVKFNVSNNTIVAPQKMETINSKQSNDEAEEQQLNNPTDHKKSRPFDVVLFAASGCVGSYLVEEMALVMSKHYKSAPGPSQLAASARRRSVPSSSLGGDEIRWALAGRSAVRLSETLGRAELSTGIKDLSSSVPLLLADLNHQKSLVAMCQKTQLVINCAGPYSELGAELLIQACIESHTNYIDLAHELTFIELMRQRYGQRAKRAQVFILNGCGFQSMSAEMGLNFTKQVADGTIEQVKIILSLSDTSTLASGRRSRTRGIVSEGMWSSLLVEKAQEISVEDRLLGARSTPPKQWNECLGGGENQERSSDDEESESLLNEEQPVMTVSAQDRRLFPTKMLARKDTQSLVKDIVQFRNRSVATSVWWWWPLRLIQGFQGKSGRGYCWPIDNLTSDEAQLIRSEMSSYELRRPDLDSHEGWRPIRCTTFLSVKNFTQLCFLLLWLFLFQFLVKFSLCRFLMRKFPQLASWGHVVGNHQSSNGASSRRSLTKSISQESTFERDSLSHIKFCQTFIAYGRPSDESADPLEIQRDKHATKKQVQLLVARIVGPEPNHVATATYAIQAAMTLLTERDHLPSKGGVLTPGAAFSDTNIIYQLRRRNIKFEVLKKA